MVATVIVVSIVVIVALLSVLFFIAIRPKEEEKQLNSASSGRIFITSDLHFYHNKPFLYEPRGFRDIDSMVDAVVERWNAIVASNDDVYVLGDLMLNDDGKAMEKLKLLNGRIHIAIGNHDTDRRIELYKNLPNVVEASFAYRLRYKKLGFYLSHYPTICSNYSDGGKLCEKTINLCGHTHTSDPFHDWGKGVIYHCELDAHNNQPVLLDDIINDLKNKWTEN